MAILSGQALSLEDEAYVYGTNVGQQLNQDNFAQKWVLSPTGEGSFVIQFKRGLCLDYQNTENPDLKTFAV
ncbi:MAG: RICIN domain-containing protein [Eggerthellaceae bacterium]|nr:RICIN domain-containing protein [Eggerthellaceae bacterium]